MRGRLLLGIVLVLTTTVGCSFSFNAGKLMSEEQVEQGISDQLTKKVGKRPDRIDCPGDLKAKVDETMRCNLISGGSSIGVTVVVTAVEGDNVQYDVQVDNAPS